MDELVVEGLKILILDLGLAAVEVFLGVTSYHVFVVDVVLEVDFSNGRCQLVERCTLCYGWELLDKQSMQIFNGCHIDLLRGWFEPVCALEDLL